jgi:aminocarboxymuconate-semialdehyde decarboxylase
MTHTSASKACDVHVHIVHEDLLEISADKVVINGYGARPPAPRPPGSRRDTNFRLMLEPDRHIADMDRRGVDVHVLSSSTVVQGTSWADASTEARLCRTMNDYMAEWVRYRPDRFVGTMVLPFQDTRAALAEMERVISEYGFSIVNAPAEVGGAYLGESVFDSYWDRAAAENLLTFIHPEGVRDPWFQQYSLWNSVGQPIEEAKVMASIIYSGLFDRYPNLDIVISHGGGYLPHYIGRLDRNVTNMPESTRNISQTPSAYLRKFYYDTCVYDPSTLARLVSIVGADRLVLGSDFPFGDADSFAVVTQAPLNDSDKSLICSHTAGALLRKVGALA